MIFESKAAQVPIKIYNNYIAARKISVCLLFIYRSADLKIVYIILYSYYRKPKLLQHMK
jgi:hypothetical protein